MGKLILRDMRLCILRPDCACAVSAHAQFGQSMLSLLKKYCRLTMKDELRMYFLGCANEQVAYPDRRVFVKLSFIVFCGVGLTTERTENMS